MDNSYRSDWTYLRRLLITVLVVGIAYAAWKLAGMLMLLFAAVLFAVLLAGFAELIKRYIGLPGSWAVAAATLVLAFVVIGSLVLFGASLASQLGELANRIPKALDAVGNRFGIPDASNSLYEGLASGMTGSFFAQAARIGYTFLGALFDIVLVVVTGIYLAADPRLYRNAVTKLFPATQQERILDAMAASTRALRLWFVGQLVSMVLVGLLSGLAFWAIGLPLPIGLGFIAGLTNFIPFVGPILGAIPAILLAFADDLTTLAWTCAAVFAIQQIEGNLILPNVQQRAVNVPPAVVLFSIAMFGVLFGLLGVILAVPLAVVLMVMIQKLWVRDVLGKPTTVPGETPEGGAEPRRTQQP